MKIDWAELTDKPSVTHSLDCACEDCCLLRAAWEEYAIKSGDKDDG